MSLRNPKWTEDELVLALDLFHDLPPSTINAANERIIRLSRELNQLRSTDVIDEETYRNPNGTALKLHNFARFDPSRTARGMTNGGKLEEVVWKKYDGKRERLRADADAIRSKLKDPALLS